MIVIYTGDVENASDTLETSCMTLRMEQVFLSELDGESIYRVIRNKVEQGHKLTEEELMQLIILPLTDKGKEKKQKRIEQVVELAKQVEEEKQAFLLMGILVCTDKFIDRAYAGELRRWMKMSAPVRRLIYNRWESDMVRLSQPPLSRSWSRNGNIRFKRRPERERAASVS